MDKDRIEGSAKQLKGSVKESVGKAVGDAIEVIAPGGARGYEIVKVQFA